MNVKQALNLILFGSIAFTTISLLQREAQAVSIGDPVGDFLPTYTGSRGGDLDIVRGEVTRNGNQLFFSADLAANIGTTPGASYIFGLNRGQGTQRFVSGTPSVGTGVFFDSVVILRPNGTGNFNDFINPANSIALNPANIAITGSQISGDFNISLFPSTGFAPSDYTWNLWTRVASISGNAGIPDFAPDAFNVSVAAVPEPNSMISLLAAVGFGAFLKIGKARRRQSLVG
jgi:hypothetical protein